MSIFQGVHWTYQHHRDRSSSVQTGVIRAKAAMDPVGNEKLGRTSSVFSTLLDDFETTPGITNASRFIESTNWNCIINKISKWKTPFISYSYVTRITTYQQNHGKGNSNEYQTSPLPCSQLTRSLLLPRKDERCDRIVLQNRGRFFHGRPKANSACKTLRCPRALRQYLRPHGE